MKIRYETEECSRCGGTGSYSWNALTGSTCFKCNGGRIQFTKKGAKARKAVQALLDELTLTPAGEIVAGDRVQLQGRKGYALVESAERSPAGTLRSNGVDIPMVSWRFPNGTGYGMPVAEMIRRKPSNDQWQQILDLASTLTGAELIETEVAAS